MFSGYGDDLEKDIYFLNKKIENKRQTLDPSLNSEVDSINLIISTYYEYLNVLDVKSSELNKNLFYEEDILMAEGEIFKKKSKIFLSDLNRILKNKDLNDYLYHFFNVDDIKTEDDMYFVYMDYHYLGIPYPTFKFLLKKRKYDLLVFQNEVLNSYLLKNK